MGEANIARHTGEPRTINLYINSETADRIRLALQDAPDPNVDANGAIAAGLQAIASNLQPADLAKIISITSDPGAPGVAIIRGLAVDPYLGPTPHDGRPSRYKSTFVSEALLLGVAALLGNPFAYAEEKDGNLVSNIVPIRNRQLSHSNAGSRRPLGFHTEAAALRNAAPDHLLLLGLRPDHQVEAVTSTADIRDAILHLTPEEIEILRGPNFKLDIPESFVENGCTHTVHTPVLTGPAESPQVTVNFDRIQGIHAHADEALAALGCAFELPGVLRETRITQGVLAIIANRRAVHGRSEFTPRWDGMDRWLQRVYVSSSLWNLRQFASPASRVISIADYKEVV